MNTKIKHMRPIQNFTKLHESEVTTPKGNSFFFEVGSGSDCSIWIFDNVRGSGIQGDYCTLMTIDWQTNSFDLRKCQLGQGFTGEDIHNKLTLPIRRCKTKAEFVSFVTELVENEAMKRTYKN
jgi:hypothetical protein